MTEATVIPIVELRDVVARCLFRDKYRLRDFDNAKSYLKKVCYMRADESIRRAGVKNMEIQVDNSFGKIAGRKGH